MINELPDETSLAEIVDRIEFLAAVQKGIGQFDRGGISRADFILPQSSFPSALPPSKELLLIPESPGSDRESR